MVVLSTTESPGFGPARTGRPRLRLLFASAWVVGAAAVGLLLWSVGGRGGAPESPSAPPEHGVIQPAIVARASSSPLEFSKGRWACPGGTLAAYVPGFHFYAPNHPLLPPPDVQPVTCFASAQWALQQGFTEALGPPGSVKEDGIWLTPVDQDVWLPECRRAAARLGFAVPCPTLLPSPLRGTERICQNSTFPLGPSSSCVLGGYAFVFSLDFDPPPGATSGTVAILAFRAEDLPDPETRSLFTCPDARPSGEIQGTGGRLISLLTCPVGPPPLAGSQLVRWVTDRVTYEVAVTSRAPPGFSLAAGVVGGLDLVEPPAG